MMVLSMPHIDLAGVIVTPADCFLGPASSASLKILRLFGRSDIPVGHGTLHGVNPFPTVWRAQPYHIDALPILNESEEPLTIPLAEPGHQFIARKLREAEQPLTILMTGPVTNLAKALTDEPELATKIEEAVCGWAVLSMLKAMCAILSIISGAEWNAPIGTHRPPMPCGRPISR
ncbi:MAG: nucleoside hydrolase [Anaerolineae bacterium]